MSLPAASRMSYTEYLKTPHWRRIRWAMLWITRGRCAICGKVDNPEIHHRDHSTLFEELPDSLTVLCQRHHALVSEQEASA